ncbi:MAG: rod shape-determining protein RodA [Acidobacteria bacterium]|nr:MAG: rod shape-determining protein RodA [Acidobacteriota bacterium]PYS54056.1 MAG: rod shape-determining protein RodA [Acidobacteriota bacterium]
MMIQPLRSKRRWKDFDWLLLAAAACLSIVSLVEIYSSTMAQPMEKFFMRQLAWVCVGIVLLFIVAAIDYHLITDHIPWVYILAIAALIYTLVLGHRVSGSKSWVTLGPVTFQPSELIKMVVVVALARYLSELRSSRYMTFMQIAKACMISLVPMGLVALQPDLGTALTYLPPIAVGLFIRGVRPGVLFSLALGFVLILPVSWLVLKPYQKERILTFLDPERDPLGKGYQVTQSKIAIGSGGLLGKGVFRGSQNRLGFLPTRHTDFIFSVVGEELGFAGVMLTLGLLAFIIFRSVHNAQTARDNLGLFIVMGTVGTYFFHLIINVGMVIGFMPTTGIPLPFLSYGGSSVLTAFIGLGLVLSVRRCRYVN